MTQLQSHSGVKTEVSRPKLSWNITNLIFFSALPIFSILLGWAYIHFYGMTWMAAGMFLGMLTLTLMSITAGYHRLFAHRAYEAAPWLKLFYLFFGAAAFQESCLKWSSEHRIHHKYVDQDQDPYNIKRGFWWAHIGWIVAADDPKSPHPEDLLDDPWVMWQYKYWLPLAIFSCFFFPAIVGWMLGDLWAGFIFGGVIRLTVAHHLTFAINSVAHSIGSQPYSDENSSRDSWITAFVTFGEGYHNYHHWYARDYRNGIRLYDWDPAKWWIRLMSFIGQAWDLKRAPEEVILRARIHMEKTRLEKHISPTYRERFEELYRKLQADLDVIAAKQRVWIEAKKKNITDGYRQELRVFKKNFQEAKERYAETYRAWQSFVREVNRAKGQLSSSPA